MDQDLVQNYNLSEGHFTHETERPWPLHFKHSHWWKRRSPAKICECKRDVKSTWVRSGHIWLHTPFTDNHWFILFYHVWGPVWTKIHWRTFDWRSGHIWLHTTFEGMLSYYMLLEVSWDGLWKLYFGLSQFHVHGSWLVWSDPKLHGWIYWSNHKTTIWHKLTLWWVVMIIQIQNNVCINDNILHNIPYIYVEYDKYSTKYCQSRITLCRLWIMLCILLLIFWLIYFIPLTFNFGHLSFKLLYSILSMQSREIGCLGIASFIPTAMWPF